jgi:serine O-acetyltransferase
MGAKKSMANRHNPAVSRILGWSTRSAPRFIRRLVCVVLGSDIGGPLPESAILPHPYGITISLSARLGENVTIMQNVTIGSKTITDWESPEIGNNVYIGAGAILLGPIKIGDTAVIGAGAVVVKDVPPGCTAVGNPARVLPAREETS